MEDSAPTYARLYPSLATFQVDSQTGAISKTRTKWREESEEISPETTFRQLLLEDRNNDSSPPPLDLSYSENSLAFSVIQGLRDNDNRSPFLLRYLED
jgi:hypothetical protein